jgi:hypothetical protein
MKNLTFLLILLISFSCSGYGQQKNEKAVSVKHVKVMVYFFHGTNRCTGCINAEKATVSVLNDLYGAELKDGSIIFQSVNIEETQYKELAEKYQVAWNMLLLVPVKDEKSKVELTEHAFTYGTNPKGLEPYIKSAIDPMLN